MSTTATKPTRPVSGYISSQHQFGQSRLIRNGSLHYIIWQHRKYSMYSASTVIAVTREQYMAIKKMLLPIKLQGVPTPYHVVSIHECSSSNYMKIKRFLIKNNILKEEKKDGAKTTTRC